MNPYDRRRRVATSSNEEELPFNRYDRNEMGALQLLLQQHQEAQYRQACIERAQEEMRYREMLLAAQAVGAGAYMPYMAGETVARDELQILEKARQDAAEEAMVRSRQSTISSKGADDIRSRSDSVGTHHTRETSDEAPISPILPSTKDRSIRGSIWAAKAPEPEQQQTVAAEPQPTEEEPERKSEQANEDAAQSQEQVTESRKETPQTEQLELATAALADKLGLATLSERESFILGMINNPDLPIPSVCDAIMALATHPDKSSIHNRMVQIVLELASRIN